jgi:16S rRNA (cytidine1402-2'-O)-methyltransferase
VGPTIGAARNHFQEHSPQGECTVVLGGAVPVEVEALTDTQCCEQLLALTAQGMSAKDASKMLSSQIGRSKRELYALLHALSDASE